jgi:hypothetical protein
VSIEAVSIVALASGMAQPEDTMAGSFADMHLILHVGRDTMAVSIRAFIVAVSIAAESTAVAFTAGAVSTGAVSTGAVAE